MKTTDTQSAVHGKKKKEEITMKKIIRGRKYDTDTAELVGEYQYSYPGQFEYCLEELYRKRTGEYFLYGTGGPMSKYSVQDWLMNEWSGGEEIIPLDMVDAKNWVEEHCDADKYKELFGVVEDDGEKVRTTLWLSKPACKMLEEQALEHRLTKSELVEYILKKESK